MAAAITAGLAVALTATACSTAASTTGSSSTTSSSGGKLTIAAVGGLASDPFWITMACGATQEAKALGVTLDWKSTPTAADATANQQNVNALLLSSPNGFIYSPSGADDNPNIQKITSKGIPVVELNGATTDTSYYQSYASSQGASAVAQVGQLIAKNAGGTGTLAVMAGLLGNPILNERFVPAVTAVRTAAPHMTVLPAEADGFDTAKTAQEVSALLIAHPGIKAVLTTSGPEGAGAVEAVQAAHDQSKVLIYSYDATPPIVTALKAGTVAALIAQSPYLMGQDGVKSLVAYLNTHKAGSAVTTASPQNVLTPVKILTAANVDAASSQPFLYKASCG
jgi:ABC-type sugar transport system substrate-binding protein